MTPEILRWLDAVANVWLQQAGDVLEVGAYNVNGSPRSILQGLADSYTGTDMQAGAGVDVVVNNFHLRLEFDEATFDTVVCCEVLEHDLRFMDTLDTLRWLLKPGGHLIITTPTFGFPLHRYPKDYWRFGEDAYREVFFCDMAVLDLIHLNSADGPKTTLAGIARK